jgi:hypothetical protein
MTLGVGFIFRLTRAQHACDPLEARERSDVPPPDVASPPVPSGVTLLQGELLERLLRLSPELLEVFAVRV